MGASWDSVGSLNAPQAAQLGVLPPSAQLPVEAAGPATTVALAPLGSRAGTRAVRLTDATGATYWLELRAAVGRDAWLAAGNRFGLDAGVLLHRTGRMPDTALLLDGSPSPAAGWDDDLRAALPVGVPVPVAGGAFTVTVDAVTATGATLTVVPAAGAAVPVTPLPEAGTAPQVLAAAPEAAAAPVPSAPAPAAAAAAVPAGVVPAWVVPPPPVAAAAPEDPAAPAPTGVQRVEPVSATVRITPGADWVPVAAGAGLAVLVLAGWGVTRRRGVRTRD